MSVKFFHFHIWKVFREISLHCDLAFHLELDTLISRKFCKNGDEKQMCVVSSLNYLHLLRLSFNWLAICRTWLYKYIEKEMIISNNYHINGAKIKWSDHKSIKVGDFHKTSHLQFDLQRDNMAANCSMSRVNWTNIYFILNII